MKTNENLTLFRVEAGVLCAGRRETTVGNVDNLDLKSGMVSCAIVMLSRMRTLAIIIIMMRMMIMITNLDLNSGMVSCDGDHDDDGHISGIFPLNMRSIKTKNASKRKSHTFLVFFP